MYLHSSVLDVVSNGEIKNFFSGLKHSLLSIPSQLPAIQEIISRSHSRFAKEAHAKHLKIYSLVGNIKMIW